MKSRKEMNPEFTWDFTHIYADNKAWESALAEADKIADTIPALKGTLGESAESLKKAMDLLATTPLTLSPPFPPPMPSSFTTPSSPTGWRV